MDLKYKEDFRAVVMVNERNKTQWSPRQVV